MTSLRSPNVMLHLSMLGEVPALVEAEDERTVVLSLMLRRPEGLADALQRPVRIECTTPRGIQRVTGTARWDASRPDEIRVTREKEEFLQRRDAVRVTAVVPALLVVVQGDSARATTTTVNVSGTGVLLNDPLGLEPGTQVRIDLELEGGGRPAVVEGPLVRAAGSGVMGMQIDVISREDEQRLARFIADRQRAELRVARAA